MDRSQATLATPFGRHVVADRSVFPMLPWKFFASRPGNNRGSYLGSGFDLKSDAYGAVRAGQGLYVATYPATSQPLDARQATSQLVNSESVLEAMSTASTTH
ncbi:hypothetical protein GGD40_005145 [Paraburkholderia bryophila]|uniref:Putative type VI secretion system Rhs element associated Vgr domain-containing protein n=1 Tax=Paraburkholderia bryophila TaxID=420952 RepID=A0A7Y9WR44_9BURK|nr:hypothetical protein [Paraburkholderia bryophila]